MSPFMPVMPEGGFTLDDLDALPEGQVRAELTDGALTISPAPTRLHQYIAGSLCLRLSEAATGMMSATWGTEIRLAASLTRIPDVLVLRSREPDRRWFSPSNVLLAVEVESPGHHVEERITRPALYAEFGIEHYWRIETDDDQFVAVVHALRDGRYAEVSRGCRIEVAEPFTFRVDLEELRPQWARREW
ncbi:Uma2 family endonuclease [Cryptosporangium sp. NPDC048952]|uniref:Uma2 family endonuclease n=1 Tax=Cryptosporangium sp. NPDC048952 TaxID=3363961 RepID=UPI00371D3B9D